MATEEVFVDHAQRAPSQIHQVDRDRTWILQEKLQLYRARPLHLSALQSKGAIGDRRWRIRCRIQSHFDGCVPGGVGLCRGIEKVGAQCDRKCYLTGLARLQVERTSGDQRRLAFVEPMVTREFLR